MTLSYNYYNLKLEVYMIRTKKGLLFILMFILLLTMTITSYAFDPPPGDGNSGGSNGSCNHNYNIYSHYNSSSHYAKCSKCSKSIKQKHSAPYQAIPGQYTNCIKCGDSFKYPCTHIGKNFEYTSPSSHSVKCSTCNKTLESSQPHHWVNLDSNENNHTLQCTKCDYIQGNPHTYEWSYDSNTHTKKCTGCSKILVNEAHNICHDSTTHSSTCSICDYTYNASSKIHYQDAQTHVTKCNDCNKVLSTHNHEYIKTRPIPPNKYVYRCLPCGDTYEGE